MVDDVKVTPQGRWDLARQVDVEEHPTGDIFHPVEIRRYPYTPGKATVDKGTFPHGIMFLNEKPMPDNTNPINTTNQFPHFTVVWIPKNKNSVEVDITQNLGWPNGVIVIPEK